MSCALTLGERVLGQAIVVRLAVSVYGKFPLIGPSTCKQMIKFDYKPLPFPLAPSDCDLL